MLDPKIITKKILQKQGFQENEITEDLFNDLHHTIQEFYTTNIVTELDEKLRSSFIFMIQAKTNIQEISNFLNKNIENYDQLITDLTYELEDQMGISGLID